jgi:hypothetical protein
VIVLSVNWAPEDQAWLLAAESRRGSVLGINGWGLLAAGGLLALAGPLADRLARWALVNPHDPALLLRPLGVVDAVSAGACLGFALLLAVASRLAERHGLNLMLQASAAEGREPLVGPVVVTLGPEEASFRAVSWDATYRNGQFSGLEEAKDHLVVRFGPARSAVLPRRDLTTWETAAVREWAAEILSHTARAR